MKDLISSTDGLRSDEVAFLESLSEQEPAVDPAEETANSIVNQMEEPTPEDSEDELDAEEEVSESDHDEEEESSEDAIEYVETSDGKKVKIDYNDRDRVKRAHLLARQGRVWQSERDKLQKQVDEIKPAYEELQSVMNALEEAKDDIPKLYELLTGGESWEDAIEKEIQQREEIASLTPEQLEVYNKHRIAEKREAELAKREAQWQRKLEEAEETKKRAEQDTQRSMITSAFNEYRFAGTLGDPAREHRLDKMVFNTIKSELNGMDASEAEVREIIKREFDALRSSVATNTKVNQMKSKNKKTAQATKKAAKGVNKSSNESSDIASKLAKGDIDGILSMDNWADLVSKL